MRHGEREMERKREKEVSVISEVTVHHSSGRILLVGGGSWSRPHSVGGDCTGCEYQEAVIIGSVFEAAYHTFL